MNNMEEQLWNYIDGNCSPVEADTIKALIDNDEVWKDKYEEQLSFNKEVMFVSDDEPSMAFTNNVLESIRACEAARPLNAATNKRIIKIISGFFIITIILLLTALFNYLDWQGISKLFETTTLKLPEVTYNTRPFLVGFLFSDTVAGLLLFDSILRKRRLKRI